jgi:hypothetical protein
MYFEIQVCDPSIRRSVHEERQDLSSAILGMFPEYTEDAILLWNWVPIRINYNADLSVMMDDILMILENLLNSDRGCTRTYFGANTFRAEWLLTWAEGDIEINAKWESVAGSYEDTLNSRSVLKVKLDEFLCEWKALLRKVLVAVKLSGIRMADEKELARLVRVEAAIPKLGKLYDTLDEFT